MTETDSWALMRRYGVPIWLDQLDPLKKKLEKIALEQYKESKDPFASLLFYMFLGKKNVVAMLFKKESSYN